MEWRWDGLGAALFAIAFALYHYRMNRDIRRTLHRIAELLAADPRSEHRHIDEGDKEQDPPAG